MHALFRVVPVSLLILQSLAVPHRSFRRGLDPQILGGGVVSPEEDIPSTGRKEVMNMDEDIFGPVIYAYTLQQAIKDGVLVEIFKNRWKELSGGKPIVATAHLFGEVSLAGLLEIWNEYVVWRKNVMPTLPEEEQMFATAMNSKKVWVIEDGQAFTLLYPEDY